MNDQDYVLLNFFLKNDSVSISELMGEFNVSKRTILKRIQKLNEDLSQRAIIRHHGVRFYLVIQDFQYINNLQSGKLKESLDLNDLSKRRAKLVLQLIFSTGYIVLDDLAESLSISKGTLNSDLKSFRQVLYQDKYPAKLISATNRGIRLVVDHNYVYGLLLKNFVSDYYRLDQNYYVQTKAGQQIQKALDDLKLTENSKTEILKNFVILKKLIQTNIRMKEMITNYLDVLDLTKLKPLIVACNQGVGCCLTKTEIYFLLQILSVYANSFVCNSKLQIALMQVQKIYSLTLTNIGQELDVTLDFASAYEQIKYHLIFMINRSVFKIQEDAFLSEGLAANYPIASELALITTHIFEQQLDLTISKSELDYLTIDYQMALNKQKSSSAENKVAIVGPVSNSIRHFVAEQMNDIFADKIQMVSFEDDAAFRRTQEHFLLVFSNYPLQMVKSQTPVVRISSIFRKEELQAKIKIFLLMEQIEAGNCTLQLCPLNGQQGYLQATEAMIREEIARGRLSKNFLDLWKKREQQTVNVFSHGIAIPHVVDDTGHKQVLLKIGLYNQAIVYARKQVKIIFLIGIPKQLDTALNKTLSEIYDFIFIVSHNEGIYQNLLHLTPGAPLTKLMEGI
ncbi:HTH domain-containing protein [Bombilactobacillus folatiphilus]|uniref:HTH domain-containing protein n=1 Tax=Bombilactobacillus folatiphilus TaxID=2923362 RepID=A0ABY4P8I1_9LACO|nr:HTH domain-containing protein [Bombilactobacillus folatiphilus]UQS81911.1 HTH domain-containing protein [Bombilactobacillus folatiphilus]